MARKKEGLIVKRKNSETKKLNVSIGVASHDAYEHLISCIENAGFEVKQSLDEVMDQALKAHVSKLEKAFKNVLEPTTVEADDAKTDGATTASANA